MQRLKQLHAPSSLITVSSVGDTVRFAFLTSTFHVSRLFRSFYRNFFFFFPLCGANVDSSTDIRSVNQQIRWNFPLKQAASTFFAHPRVSSNRKCRGNWNWCRRISRSEHRVVVCASVKSSKTYSRVCTARNIHTRRGWSWTASALKSVVRRRRFHSNVCLKLSRDNNLCLSLITMRYRLSRIMTTLSGCAYSIFKSWAPYVMLYLDVACETTSRCKDMLEKKGERRCSCNAIHW